MTRRTFLAAPAAAVARAAQSGDDSLRTLISDSDLAYDKPVARSEEGMPIGNGRTGTLVWTTPQSVRMQINRVDVYANNSYTNSFFERHNDYCGGCGFVDLEFGREIFPESGFPQTLSVFDGLLKVANIEALAWPEQDVVAVQTPAPAEVSLRMLRAENKYYGGQLENMVRDHVVTVQTRSHTAASRLEIRGECIVLTQEFREGDYCCKSAVAIGKGKGRVANETEGRLRVDPGVVLIASAATFDPKEDVAAVALRQLEAAATKGYGKLREETADWWHAFWERGWISLQSADGIAREVARNYHYFLYLMAATSRGKFPPKFNGMLWNTAGDLRTWGAQHWYANTSCYYEAIFACNRMELLDPFFEMYSGMYEASATAARQQWDSQGIYIAETSYFNGLEKLPDDIASEMQDLYLLRKAWEERSERFKEFASTKHPHSSRWNWIQSGEWKNGRWVTTERGFGPYGAVNHIFGSTAKIAYYYWRRYEFTLDREWLSTRAYPMLKGAVEFYRNYPNVKRGDDGKWHIHSVNSNESVFGARDTDEDISAMRSVTAVALRSAEILGLDRELQAKWREFLESLAPLPTSDDPDALKPDGYTGPRVFVRGRKPVIKPGGLTPDANSLPMFLFDLVNSGPNHEVAMATFNASLRNGPGPQTNVSVLSKMAIAAAQLGRADAVRYMIPAQIEARVPERSTAYKGGAVLANRMTLREGPQALDAQRLGRAAEALHIALLRSNPPGPGEDSVIEPFAACPKEWTARFKLLARGGFVVTGSPDAIEIEATVDGECRLKNPWTGAVERFGMRRGEKRTVRKT
ncbi:MAG TPA: hypothetical protein VMJ34_10020 [Bryobacteraceae bacterium]|nr:hypothetical protein [Bryobacteraceae bacterium]